ncbi:MAG: AAA family ATPase [Planctomycetota bacterium]
MITSSIPDELRRRDQWVVWVYETRGGKRTKVPVGAGGELASSTDPATWSSFDVASEASRAMGAAGVGFVFTADDPFCGVDLDDCLIDGRPTPQAWEIIDRLSTYCEVSPSGSGVKLIGRGSKPGDRCRTKAVEGFGELEMYDQGRYFAITGDRLAGTPPEVNDFAAALAGLYGRVFGAAPPHPSPAPPRDPAPPVNLDDASLLERIARSAGGPKFARLWRGDAAEYGDDRSRADAALCGMLAFWCGGDADRIDRLFRQSGLMRPKWDERRGQTTYGRMTIEGAAGLCREHYRPQSRSVRVEPAPTPQPDDDALDAFDAELEAILSGQRRPQTWPWRFVTGLTRSLLPGTLTILCGSPGATKSFFLLQAAAHWHEVGATPAVLMLEDGREYHLRRALAQRERNGHLTDIGWVEQHGAEVVAMRARHAAWLQNFGRCLYEPPAEGMFTHDQAIRWAEERARDGHRVVAIDPISMLDADGDVWREDKRLIAALKQTAERHHVSVVAVTHPRKGAQGVDMDEVSGGASVSRFAQTVIWLKYLPEPESRWCGTDPDVKGARDSREVNRHLVISKARNGVGTGRKVGFLFDGKSLTFREQGLLMKGGEA